MKLVERKSLREEILASMTHNEKVRDMSTEDRKILWDMMDEQLNVKGLNKTIVPVLFSVVVNNPNSWKALCSKQNIETFFYSTPILKLIDAAETCSQITYFDMETELTLLLTKAFIASATQ